MSKFPLILLVCATLWATDLTDLYQITPEHRAMLHNSATPAQIESRLIRVGLDGLDSFYGTALLYRATPQKLFYVTVNHVLPQSPERRVRLHAIGHLTDFKHSKVEIIGRAPGYDLAVFAIPRTSRQSFSEVSNLAKTESQVFHVGIAGIPDRMLVPDQKPLLKSEVWEEEATRLRKNLIQQRETETFSSGAVERFQLSGQSVRLERRRDCPPLFLDECFHVPMRSWGYSGGVLLAAAARNAPPQIAGLVSHFSPLATTTYVIPIDVVWRVAGRLMAKGSETVDESGMFKLLADGRVEIIGKGMQVGAVPANGSGLAGINDLVPGGGESSAGGGESSAGGGESSAGGGESSAGGGDPITPHVLLPTALGEIEGLADFSKITQEVAKPSTWHRASSALGSFINQNTGTLGSSALLKFRPGIQVEDLSTRGRQQYHRYGSQALINLQHFLVEYRSRPDQKLEASFPSRTFPSILESPAKGSASPLVGSAKLRALRSLNEINQKLTPTERASYGLDIYAVTFLLAHWKYGGKIKGLPVDTVTARAEETTGLAPWRGVLQRQGNETVLEFLSPWGQPESLRFSGSLVQMGEYFWKYQGPLTISGPAPAQGMVVLQYLPLEKQYELKALVAESNPLSKLSPLHQSGEVKVTGYYFPLVPASQAVSVQLTPAYKALIADWVEAAKNRPAPLSHIGARIPADAPVFKYQDEFIEQLDRIVGFSHSPR